MHKLFTITLFLYACSFSYVYAYIDPGTGSIILHAILAFFAGCITWIIAKYKLVKSFLKRKLSKEDKVEKN